MTQVTYLHLKYVVLGETDITNGKVGKSVSGYGNCNGIVTVSV